MSPLKKTTIFWSLFFVCIFGLTYALSGILLPFILGFILAYMLNPLVLKLQKHHFSRTWGTVVVILGLCLTLFASLLILIPILEAQVIAFMVKVPTLSSSLWTKIQPLFDAIKEHISSAQLPYLKESIAAKASNFVSDASNALMSLFTGWGALFNTLSFIIITPIVAFYLLLDWQKIVASIQSLYPRKSASFLNEKISQINEILSAFIRGQAIVCLFLGLFYGLGLSVIGLDFGFSIGFIAGIFSFIPYVGSLTGFVLSLLLAFTQSTDWSLFIGILLVFGIGQFLEGYILTPKLVGDKIHLHPVWVIFALFAGGYLFGFLGVLLAVPVAAVFGVVVRTAVEFYEKSSYYKGNK